MIFAAFLYSQFELKEKIILDSTKTLIPLGWASLIDYGSGIKMAPGFKFAYFETNVKQGADPLEYIGFTNTSVKQFLEFFCFLTGDGQPINQFEEIRSGTRYFKTITEAETFIANAGEHGTRSGDIPIIQSEFIIKHDFRFPIGRIFFPKAWQLFLAMEARYRNMVSVYFAKLDGIGNAIYKVFNTETLKLFLLITIIEGLLSPRNACGGKLSCSKCGDLNLGRFHFAENTADFWRKELNKMVKFPENVRYIDFILSLQQIVRNPFAHWVGSLPDASHVPSLASGPHTRFLRFNNVVNLINNDSLARMNAIHLLRSIVWLLLMDKFFPGSITEPWPDFDLIKETRSYGINQKSDSRINTRLRPSSS